MTTTELRRTIKKKVDALPEDRLALAEEFIRFLTEQTPNSAIEHRKAARLKHEIAKAEADFSRGRGRNWREVRADV